MGREGVREWESESVREWESKSAEARDLPDPRSHSPTLSLSNSLRAWLYLVWLSFQRQRRNRQMVWIALALLLFTTVVIGLNTKAGMWGMGHWRWWMPVEQKVSAPHAGPSLRAYGQQPQPAVTYFPYTYAEVADQMELLPHVMPWPTPALSVQEAVAGSCRALLDRTGFIVFSKWMVFSVFISFLLPIWSLSFASDAIGGERESRNLVWLLTRPLPKPAIYLAKFVAVLPWTLGLNLGGFGVLCLAAGQAGQLAFRLYWPAVLWATLAFCALFHLMGAWFRRAGIVALVRLHEADQHRLLRALHDVRRRRRLRRPARKTLGLPASGCNNGLAGVGRRNGRAAHRRHGCLHAHGVPCRELRSRLPKVLCKCLYQIRVNI